MATLDHPFITRLVRTYTDSKRVHILMDFAIGGEVFSYLGTPFPVAYVRFYAGMLPSICDKVILLMFPFAHSLRCVYACSYA